MFVRKKKNSSGVISIQVIDKSSGSYTLIKTIGSSADPRTIEQLYLEGQKWVENYSGQLTIEFSQDQYAKEVARSIKSIKAVGIELLITKYYNEIGFNEVDSDILRLLVISRIANPVSKYFNNLCDYCEFNIFRIKLRVYEAKI
jgi:hypothetical protein